MKKAMRLGMWMIILGIGAMLTKVNRCSSK